MYYPFTPQSFSQVKTPNWITFTYELAWQVYQSSLVSILPTYFNCALCVALEAWTTSNHRATEPTYTLDDLQYQCCICLILQRIIILPLYTYLIGPCAIHFCKLSDTSSNFYIFVYTPKVLQTVTNVGCNTF